MTKQLNKFAVYTISVLTAKILSEHLFDFIIAYKKNQNPYIDTVVGMAITAFIFFPAIVVMNKYLKVLTEKYLKQSKKTVKKNNWGFILGILVAFVILYYVYLMKWYGIDLLKTIYNSIFL